MPEQWPVETIRMEELKAHPRNYQGHPEEELEQIAASLREHGLYRNVVVARDGTLLAGHGVVQAARDRLGWEEIRAVRLPLEPEDPRAIKILASDNEIARLAVKDQLLLGELLREVMASGVTELMGSGHDEASVEELLNRDAIDDTYTRKIEAPIYEPRGPKPEVADLYDRAKTEELLEGIAQAEGLSEGERAFLMAGAQRHTVFHFERIAEFYAQSESGVQRLMEEQALVIIDFEAAVEQGFVRMSERLRQQVEEEYGD